MWHANSLSFTNVGCKLKSYARMQTGKQTQSLHGYFENAVGVRLSTSKLKNTLPELLSEFMASLFVKVANMFKNTNSFSKVQTI